MSSARANMRLRAGVIVRYRDACLNLFCGSFFVAKMKILTIYLFNLQIEIKFETIAVLLFVNIHCHCMSL